MKLILIGVLLAASIFPSLAQSVSDEQVAYCGTDDPYAFVPYPNYNNRQREYVEIATSADGEYIAVARLDAVTLYSLTTNEVRDIRPQTDDAWSITLEWSPVENHLAVVPNTFDPSINDLKGTVFIYDAIQDVYILQADAPALNDIAWSSDGQQLALAHIYSAISLWEPRQDNPINLLVENRIGIETILWIADDDYIVTVRNNEGAIIRWSLDSGSATELGTYPSDPILDWNPQRGLLAGMIAAATPYTLEVNTGDVQILLPPPQSPLLSVGNKTALAWSPDGSQLAVGGDGEGFLLIDINTEEVVAYNAPNMPEFTRINWLPDNERLVGVTQAGTVFIWNIPDNCLERIIEEQRIAP